MSDRKIFMARSSFTAAANATDLFVLTGAANRTVRLLRLRVAASNSAGAAPRFFPLVKRSADNTGGTRSAFTAVAVDGVSVAAATAAGYTANPAGRGAAVGTLFAPVYSIQAVGSATYGLATVWDSKTDPPLVLQPNEVVALTLGGAAVSGTTIIAVAVEWDEI